MLKEKGAKEFTMSQSQILANFLNRERDFPIVCHNVRYDRDEVLRPAFERVNNLVALPHNDRWICTMKLAYQRTDLIPKFINKGLDPLLHYLELG